MSHLGRTGKLSQRAYNKLSFLATAGQTVKAGLSYVAGFVEVYVNGTLLTDVVDYSASNGNSVTFLVALSVDDEVTVVSLKTFSVANMLPLSGGTVAGDLGVSGSVTADGLVVDGTATVSGNVGIGTSFPTAPLHTVSSENLVAKFSSSDVTSGIRIEDTTTSYDFYVDSGNLRINNTAGLERLRIDAAGDVEFSSGNGGIYLGGRAAANRLDHYEEGTWTPTVGGTWSTAPTALSGTYIKIGSLVYVKVNFSGGAKTSATTGWIDGNPFNQVGGGSTGSVSDSSVSDRGNCLFANTTRIWLTSTSFSGGANYLSGSYNTDA